jgi:hypothetical protein
MSAGLPTRKARTFGLKGILSFLRGLIFPEKGNVLPVGNPVKTRSVYSGHYRFFKLRLKMFPGIVIVGARFFTYFQF